MFFSSSMTSTGSLLWGGFTGSLNSMVATQSRLRSVHDSNGGCFFGGGGSEDADGQNHHIQALELESLLQSEGGVVMEQASQNVFLLENQFSGKENGPGKFTRYGPAQLFQFLDEIGSEGIAVLGIPTQTVAKVHETLE